MERTKNWAEAPQELLGLIAEHLISLEDYARFGAVCRSWKAVIVDKCQSNFTPTTLPWLMYPLYKGEGDENYVSTNNVFNLAENKFYKISLPETRNCSCSGSPYGWLLLLSGVAGEGKVEILNPLTHVRLSLPPLTSFEGYFVSFYCLRKYILAAIPSCSSPTNSVKDQLVAFIFFDDLGKLGYARPGDGAWTSIEIPSTCTDDILYFKDQVYGIDTNGIVWCFDITRPNPVGTEFALPSDDMVKDDYADEDWTYYLVELLGELHMVLKILYAENDSDSSSPRMFEDYNNYNFRIFRLDLCTRKWVEVFTFRDYAIFVGRNTSFSLQVSNYPWFEFSSIYFTDHRISDMDSRGDMGFYNFDTKTIHAWHTEDDVGPLYSAPVWFMPSFC